ncbi:hypothetical protein OSTOST_19459 [Ostertagia ostertagi]
MSVVDSLGNRRHQHQPSPIKLVKERVLRIENELESYFRRWKLTRLATFFWLKVTLEGDPVCSFNSSHKLPYERLVFASRTEYSTRYSAISAADGKVLVSVPMAVPSRKPPILPILKQYGVVPERSALVFLLQVFGALRTLSSTEYGVSRSRGAPVAVQPLFYFYKRGD